MSLRDEFMDLGVPDDLLAQVIWAEFEDVAYSPRQLVDLARRLFPDDVHTQVEKALCSTPPARRVRDLQQSLTRLRRIA
jgi:hypothetical protein